MRRRAFTIAEVLVASAVFLGLAACLLLLYRMGLGARRRHEAHQQSHRAALQCISYLRNELRVIQLLEPSAFIPPAGTGARSDEMLYRRPAFAGPLQIDGSGTPIWQETCRLRFQADKQLWRIPDNPDVSPRALVNMGSGGEVWFSRVNDRLLKVEIRADFGDPKAVVTLRQNFLLPNQP